MIDTEVVLAALNALCTDGAAPLPSQTLQAGFSAGAPRQTASIKDLTHLALCGAEPWTVEDATGGINLPEDMKRDKRTGAISLDPDVVWSAEHLDPEYNHSYPEGEDTESYSRGGEEYKRPRGWQRFALKVLDKFEDNTWLGHTSRSTESVPGEWPVSYHGTWQESMKSIIEGNLKAGDGAVYGRGVYSTPDIKIAEGYAKEFICKRDKYKVILQNRINPKYRKICSYKDYWLIPTENKSEEEEREIIKKALRPYGILLMKV